MMANNNSNQETSANINETEAVPKFNRICRVCLCETNEIDKKLDTRIIVLNNTQEIGSLLEESTGVKILNLEHLPNTICDRCFKTLIAWYRFRSQTQRSNIILTEYSKKLKSSADNKLSTNADLTINMESGQVSVSSSQQQKTSEVSNFEVSFAENEYGVMGFVFHCDSCEMTFSNQIDADKHQEEHSKSVRQKSFKCKHCPKSYAFRNGLHNHMKLSHDNSKRYKFQCDICLRHYASPTGFNTHKNKTCVPVGLIAKCKIRQLNVRKEKLIEAAEKIIRETKFSCFLCKKEFKNRDDFINHYPKHSKDRECDICNKVFARAKMLERHVRMHTGATVFDCPMCSRSFYTCQAFRVHVLEHGKREWVYKCNFCTQEFFIVSEFEKHMVNHLNAMKCDKNAVETEVLKGGGTNVVQTKNNYDMETDNECDSNTSANDELNQSSDVKEPDILKSPEPFQVIKFEEDSEKYTENVSERNNPIKKETDPFEDMYDSKETIILTHLEGIKEGNINKSTYQQYKAEDAVKTENCDNMEEGFSDLRETIVSDRQEGTYCVKVEKDSEDNPSNDQENEDYIKVEMHDSIDIIDEIKTEKQEQTPSDDETADTKQNFSEDEPGDDETGGTISTSKAEMSEFAKDLLEKCKVNCHIPGCKMKFANLPDIWEHFAKEHLSGEKKPFQCSICFETFEQKYSFRPHLKKHYSFKCPICFKVKVSSSELKKHVIFSHSKYRPFKCSQCDQSFNRIGALKVHENTHSDKKEFVCNVCSKDFFSYNGLYLHSKSHKIIKELQCTRCNRQLPSKSRLKLHIKANNCNRKQKK